MKGFCEGDLRCKPDTRVTDRKRPACGGSTADIWLAEEHAVVHWQETADDELDHGHGHGFRRDQFAREERRGDFGDPVRLQAPYLPSDERMVVLR